MMKFIATMIILLLASGCTTFKPVGLETEKLHEQLYSGGIIQVEDEVKIRTADGIDHRFEVLEIKENRIVGSEIDIPIENIVAIEKRELSVGKTAFLVGGILGTVILMAVIPAPNFSFGASY